MTHARSFAAAAVFAILWNTPAPVHATDQPVQVALRPVMEGTDVVTDINVVGDWIYACTQPGLLLRTRLPSGSPTVFLDLRSKVGTLGSRIPALPGLGYPAAGTYDERGLLGFAAHPDFVRNGLFWVWYSAIDDHTASPPGFFQWLVSTSTPWDMSQWDHVDRLEEYRVVGGAPVFQRTLLKLKRPYFNHTGFQSLVWSPELDTLVLGLGDGGSEYDPNNIAQDDDQLSGKLLRIDLARLRGRDYTSDPPVATFTDLRQLNVPDGAFLTLAKGLRNPSKLHHERAPRHGDGDDARWIKYLANTGQDTIEWIDAFDDYGINVGFRPWEGIFPTSFEIGGTRVISYGFEAVQLRNHYRPLVSYSHLDPVLRPNANTGSALYRGRAIPGLTGQLVFTDWFSFDPATHTSKGLLLHAPVNRSDLQEQQPVAAVDVDSSPAVPPGSTLYYTSINTNPAGDRIFIGGYKSVQFILNPGEGGVYEVVAR
jgi:hypothetical protein